MPHVGGGSNSGGFHSSSSGTSSIPRTDIYGNKHSTYYVRPGYYYHGIYVPYSRVHRGFYAIRTFLILILVSIALFISAFVASKNVKTSLEDYSLNRYSEVYEKGSNYESNILIEIIAYDNLKEIDYMPIVGDNIALTVDEMFGNEKSYFGSIFANNLSKYDEKVTNLYTILTVSINETNNNIKNKYYTNNTKASKVLNNTSFNLGDKTGLEEALNNFYDLTGYNLTVDVNIYDNAYKIDYTVMWVLIGFGGLMLVYSIFSISRTITAVKAINKEDKNGNLKEYYEGEVDYETQTKKYSMDEPYKYNKEEYEKLKKECMEKDDFKEI